MAMAINQCGLWALHLYHCVCVIVAGTFCSGDDDDVDDDDDDHCVCGPLIDDINVYYSVQRRQQCARAAAAACKAAWRRCARAAENSAQA